MENKQVEAEELDEVLSIAQRQKRSQIIRANKNKLKIARRVARGKHAPQKIIKKRAYALARKIIRRKFAGKRDADYANLSVSEKMVIDKAIESKTKLIKKLALRLIPRIQNMESKRLQSFMAGKKLENLGKKEMAESLNEKFAEIIGKKKEEKDKEKSVKGSSSPNIKFYRKFSEEKELETPTFLALKKKSDSNNIDIDILGEVYNRGCDCWKESYNYSMEQYAFARVNSFINKGKTYFKEDADLHEVQLARVGSPGASSRRWIDHVTKKRTELSQSRRKNAKKLEVVEAVDPDYEKKLQAHLELSKKIIDKYGGIHQRTPKGNGFVHAAAFGKPDHVVLRNNHEDDRIVHIKHLKTEQDYMKKESMDEAWTEKDRFGKDVVNVKNPCGKGFSQQGVHIVNGKEVPSCVKNTNESWMMSHQGAGGEPEKRYDKWGKDGVDKWKSAVSTTHGKHVKFEKKDYKDHSKTHAHVGETEVGRYSHYNDSSSMLRKKINESNNTPHVRPHYGDTNKPEAQTGWKASNKHGKVKLFGMKFQDSANRHAGLNENWSKGSSTSYDSDRKKAVQLHAALKKSVSSMKGMDRDSVEYHTAAENHAKMDAKYIKHSYHAGQYGSMQDAKKDHSKSMSDAKRHREHLNKLSEESIVEGDPNPAHREVGTDSATKIFANDTPGQGKHTKCGTPDCCGECNSVKEGKIEGIPVVHTNSVDRRRVKVQTPSGKVVWRNIRSSRDIIK